MDIFCRCFIVFLDVYVDRFGSFEKLYCFDFVTLNSRYFNRNEKKYSKEGFMHLCRALSLPQTIPRFMCLQYSSFDSAKRRNCSLRAISPFPTVFSPCLDNFLPFSLNLKLLSANSLSLEEAKICCLGEGNTKKVIAKLWNSKTFCLYNKYLESLGRIIIGYTWNEQKQNVLTHVDCTNWSESVFINHFHEHSLSFFQHFVNFNVTQLLIG